MNPNVDPDNTIEQVKPTYLASPPDIGIIENLRARRSIRAFKNVPVDRSLVLRILQLAQRAPSAANHQPWKVYVLDGALKKRVSERVQLERSRNPSKEKSKTYFGEHRFYPETMPPGYHERQRKIGWDLYELCGVKKGDREASWRVAGRNYDFFDAPVGMSFTASRELQIASWIDCGCFINSIALIARSFALDTCIQAAWCHYHEILRELLGIPPDEVVVSGLSLGVMDPDAPANRLLTKRKPIKHLARFVGQTAASARE